MRCDLLEKSYFCSIANNHFEGISDDVLVVICLKNRTFAVSQTTQMLDNSNLSQLWFAWKIVLLQYRKQLPHLAAQHEARCDLLEKSYFCSIANNWWQLWPCAWLVVICLKNRTFAVSQTTRHQYYPFAWTLWFAWKIVLLQYRKQLDNLWYDVNAGCDLLEKSYFCSIANNVLFELRHFGIVVICLKNRTFAVSQTTYWQVQGMWLRVVICLKNRTFAVSQTTLSHNPRLSD